jgi:hypothetical protein
MALCSGRPVLRSQTSVVSRWLVIPIAAMSSGPRPARSIAERQVPAVVDHRSPGIVLDPARRRIVLRELFLRDRLHLHRGIEDDRAARGRALVDGQDVLHATCLPCPVFALAGPLRPA